MLSCKEAVTLILKKEEGNISFLQQVRLWRHFAICSLCRIFSKQNTLINNAIKQRPSTKLTLTEKEKHNIINNIFDERRNQRTDGL